MPAARVPLNEAQRLQSLRALELLDTPTDPHFDNTVEAAANFFGAPMAAISFIDAERQWFKARRGLDVAETPRSVAFCAHTILRPVDTLCVPDARSDPRFFDNPLVMGEPGIRFYLGAPILCPGGQPLGALCVIDQVPRGASESSARHLQHLARGVTTSIHLHRTLTKLRNLAINDQLTGVFNRAGFAAALQRRINEQRLRGMPLAPSTVVGLDLRNFKAVNDLCGHSGGDQVMREIVARLKANLWADDLIARIGGDEFAIYIGNLEARDAVIKLRDRIERVFADPFEVGCTSVTVEASIGLSVVEPVHEDNTVLLAAADAALFAAKHHGVQGH